ncbi:hypothetical protein D9M68_912400 [compost metagenome]
MRILKAETGGLCAVPPSSRRPAVAVETVAGGGHLFPMTHADITRDALFDLAV